MGSIFGGDSGAGEAAEAQERGTLAGVEEQRRQFDITQAQAAPFRQAGLSALQQQLALLGLPGLAPEQFGAAAGQLGAPALGGIAPTRGQFTVVDEQGQLRTLPTGSLDPRPFNLGGLALAEGAAAPAAGPAIPPAVSREQALAGFAETPGQAFLRERQERALLRSASAIGGLGGGNIRTALQEQAFGRGATQLGEFQNRLAALSGSGQVATQNVAQLGAQTSGNIANLLQAGGQARASGILGEAQAGAAGTQQLLGAGLGAAAGGGLFGAGAAGLFGGGAGAGALIGLLSDRRLKKNIVKIGQLENGLNWYRWDWTEEGKRLAKDQDTEGVIAQEVMAVLPHAVTKVGEYLTVNYKELR